jgi:RNA recognition motif-containing protein
MGNRLYVGNLSYNTTEDDLKTLFEEAGAVTKCDVIIDKFTSKSRGFGFVEMATDDDAQKAIDHCNGKEFDGRTLVVNEARPRAERSSGDYGGGGGGGGGYSGGGDRGYSGGGGGGGGGGRGGQDKKRASGKGSRRGIRNAKRGGDGYW